MNAELARALVALPGFKWKPGMLVKDYTRTGLRVVYTEADSDPAEPGSVVLYEEPGTFVRTGRDHRWGVHPDLDDAATGGCLLGMLHATGALLMVEAPEPAHAYWCVYLDGPPGHVEGPTLAHACAAALVALGRAG